jgi:outer membrane lipoprotein-sorting protein
MLLNANGKEMKVNQASLLVSDGEFDYTINETLGNKQVFKGRPKKSLEFEPTQMFKYMREQSELKLLPEEKLEGEDVYVVETRPKKPTPNAPIARSLYYFSKETGAPLRMVSKNDKDEDVQIMQFSALEFDARIDPDRFKFEAPEGVKVIDQTSAP